MGYLDPSADQGDPANPMVLRLLRHLDSIGLASPGPSNHGLADEVPEFRHDWRQSLLGSERYMAIQTMIFALATIGLVGVAVIKPQNLLMAVAFYFLFLIEFSWVKIDFSRIQRVIKNNQASADLIRQIIAGTFDFKLVHRRVLFPMNYILFSATDPSLEARATFLARNLDWFVLKPPVCFRGNWILLPISVALIILVCSQALSLDGDAGFVAFVGALMLLCMAAYAESWRSFVYIGHLTACVEREYLITKQELKETKS